MWSKWSPVDHLRFGWNLAHRSLKIARVCPKITDTGTFSRGETLARTNKKYIQASIIMDMCASHKGSDGNWQNRSSVDQSILIDWSILAKFHHIREQMSVIENFPLFWQQLFVKLRWSTGTYPQILITSYRTRKRFVVTIHEKIVWSLHLRSPLVVLQQIPSGHEVL